MRARPCCRVSCSRRAEATLTFDYADRVAVIGPLAFVAEPHTYDLCRWHADRVTLPAGWSLIRPTPVGADGAMLGRD